MTKRPVNTKVELLATLEPAWGDYRSSKQVLE